MRYLSDLSESEQSLFVNSFKFIGSLTEVCIVENIQQIAKLSRMSDIDAGIRYLKLHHYTLVSAMVEATSTAIKKELSLIADDSFSQLVDDFKAQIALDTFNKSKLLLVLPFFKHLHGQDILLYRCLEAEGMLGGVDFFELKPIRRQICANVLKLLGENLFLNEVADYRTATTRLYGELISSKSRQEEVDLNFLSIPLKYAHNKEQEKFLSEMSGFLENHVPKTVWHGDIKENVFVGKAIEVKCPCGRMHGLDFSEIICETSNATIYSMSCGESILKVQATGLFRVNGAKVVGKFWATPSRINLMKEVISARKVIS